MTLIRRPSPLTEMASLREAMEQLFDERVFRPLWPWNGDRQTVPALDMYTTPSEVVAKIALPGVKPDEIDVTIADDVVTVRGTFAEERGPSEEGYVHRELTRGTFDRRFIVPCAVKPEAATASFKDGLLTLTLPKTEEVKPKHLKVEVNR